MAGRLQAGRTARRVVVADADAAVRRRVVSALLDQGYTTETADHAQGVLEVVERRPADLVILDVVLPTATVGWGLLARLGVLGVPVIVYAAQAAEPDRVAGLELGADDYVGKSCSPRELVARVRAVLRRLDRSGVQADRLVYDELLIDVRSHQVSIAGRTVRLRPREFELLVFLARSPGQVFSRVQLLERVWHSDRAWQTLGTVTEHMRRLRLAIEPDPAHTRWLATVRGVGYRFDP